MERWQTEGVMPKHMQYGPSIQRMPWSVGGWTPARVDEGQMLITDLHGFYLGRVLSIGRPSLYGERDIVAELRGFQHVAWAVPTDINGELIQPITFWPYQDREG